MSITSMNASSGSSCLCKLLPCYRALTDSWWKYTCFFRIISHVTYEQHKCSCQNKITQILHQRTLDAEQDRMSGTLQSVLLPILNTTDCHTAVITTQKINKQNIQWLHMYKNTFAAERLLNRLAEMYVVSVPVPVIIYMACWYYFIKIVLNLA
jgi:hypothetical protein